MHLHKTQKHKHETCDYKTWRINGIPNTPPVAGIGALVKIDVRQNRTSTRRTRHANGATTKSRSLHTKSTTRWVASPSCDVCDNAPLDGSGPLQTRGTTEFGCHPRQHVALNCSEDVNVQGDTMCANRSTSQAPRRPDTPPRHARVARHRGATCCKAAHPPPSPGRCAGGCPA